MTVYATESSPTQTVGESPALDWSSLLVSGGIDTGETSDTDTALTYLQDEYALLRILHREAVCRYEQLRAAAQGAVVEARTGRRNPITPIVEALAELGESPAAGARLHSLVPESAAAWPNGAVG